jgi:hypothetical protein
MADIYADQDALSRKEQQESLYADRVKVYPKKIDGPVRSLKWAVVAVLLSIYYLAPWLRWDRGPAAPDQAFLIDMPHRRAYILWIEIWPQELYFLVGLLLLGALGMFFVTSLFGRIWCGYTCPQTVWTDLFMWVERLIEGDRNQRMRLDKAQSSVSKVWKKTAKHGAWTVIAFLTGGAWIMYFNDAQTVVPAIFTGEAGLHRPDLSAGRMGARTGLYLHVPVAKVPIGHVRRRHADCDLSGMARRTARQTQEG